METHKMNPEVAARQRRWAAAAQTRLDAARDALREVADRDADAAFASLVARLAAIVEQGQAVRK